MKSIIICIGHELLLGDVMNTNATTIERQMAAQGFRVIREVTVSDELPALTHEISTAMADADVVFCIGGLGPTDDDITRLGVSEATGRGLQHQPEIEAHIRGKRRPGSRVMPDSCYERQAEVLDGARVLTNSVGTAPGQWLSVDGDEIILLPGPPRELEPMFEQEVLPELCHRFEVSKHRESVYVMDVPESLIEERARKAVADLQELELGYCIHHGQTELRLECVVGHDAVLDEGMARLRAEFGDAVIECDAGLVGTICDEMRERGWQFACAESCTGGGIGAAVTDRSGVSDVFAGGVMTYSNEMKQLLLGVSADTLTVHGAVSTECAEEMVRGLCTRLNVKAGIAVTGIAGPTGGTDEKPVGLVYIATCVDGDVRVEERHFGGERDLVRRRTVTLALNQLRLHMMNADTSVK
jgi:nicotinamide-nucleotide amidase